MKKILASIFIMLYFALNAFASINSVSDIESKISKLNQLNNYNFINLVNKTDLIGERLQSFDMLSSQYKNEVFLASENLKNIINQINLIKGADNISDSEKTLQISKLYQDTQTILYNIDSKTVQYLYGLRTFMPTITYQKYSVSFSNFYNGLNISDKKIISK